MDFGDAPLRIRPGAGASLFEPAPRLDPETCGVRPDATGARLSRLGRAAFLLLAAVSVLAVALRSLTHHPRGDVFRRSEELSAYEAARTDLPDRLYAHLRRHPEQCGAAGAALRVYQRVVALRTEDGSLLTLVNPSFVPFERARWGETAEHSWLCDPPVTQTRIRAEAGRARHWVRDGWQATTVRGAAARCLQHLLEEMDGGWWCPPEHTVWPRPSI